MADARETILIYNAVLKRDPSDEELAFFVANTQTEAEEDAQIEALVNSGEADAFVDPIVLTYQAVLDRVPDEAGLDFWVNVNRDGTVALETIITGDPDMGIDGFQFSDEFIADYGRNVDPNGEEFITQLYRNLLNREPDEEGFEFFTNLPESATVGEVVLAFINSEEFQAELDPLVDIFLTKAANGEQDYEGSLADTDDDGDVDDDDFGQADFDASLVNGTLTISGNAEEAVEVRLDSDPATVNGEGQPGDVETVDASGLNNFGLNLFGGSAGQTIIGSEQSDTIRSNGATVDGNGGDDIFGVGDDNNVTGGDGADEFHVTSNSENNVFEDFGDDEGDEITFLDNGNTDDGNDVEGDTDRGSVDFAASADDVAGAAGGDFAESDLDRVDTIQDVDNEDNHLYIVQGQQTEAQIATQSVTDGAQDSYVVVFNQTSGRGELWFDDDWSSVGGRSKVATLNSITTLAGVTALTAADFGVYSTNEGGVEGPDDGGTVDELMLTTGRDTFSGEQTEGNTLYTGENAFGTEVADTLNDLDSIQDASGDNDIIRAQIDDGATPLVSGVEVIRNQANTSLDADDITGLEEYWDDADNTAPAGITNASLSTTFGSTGGGVFNITFDASEDLSATNDSNNFDDNNSGTTVSLAVDDNNGDDAGFALPAGVENVSVAAMGSGGSGTTGDDVADDVFLVSQNDLETVTVTGGGNIDLTITSNAFDLLDAEAATGDVTATVTSGAPTGDLAGEPSAVLLGGSGDDVLSAAAVAVNAAGAERDVVIRGGAGDDTLTGSTTGDNLLDGGDGADDMTGGADDIFVVSSEGVADRGDLDDVTGFTTAVDSIVFADISVDGGADGAVGSNYDEATGLADYDAALAAANAAFAADANLVYFAADDGSDTFVFADSNGDDSADQAVELSGILVAAFDGTDIEGNSFIA